MSRLTLKSAKRASLVEASSASASIGNWLRRGGGFPLKTKRRRAS